MFAAILILFLLPILDVSKTRSLQFRPFMKFFYWLFVGNFFILMWIGANHAEPPFLFIGSVATIFYFSYFLIIIPFISILENTLADITTSDINSQLYTGFIYLGSNNFINDIKLPYINLKSIRINNLYRNIRFYSTYTKSTSLIVNEFKGINLNNPWINIKYYEIPISKWPPELIEWFVGFTDAEGMFKINNPNFSSGRIQTSMLFQIKLHIDHLPLLEWMQSNLFNGGYIQKDNNTVAFIVKKLAIIENILIPIFKRFPLNTKKYLDFKDWLNILPLLKNKSYKEVYNQK